MFAEIVSRNGCIYLREIISAGNYGEVIALTSHEALWLSRFLQAYPRQDQLSLLLRLASVHANAGMSDVDQREKIFELVK